MSKLSNSERWKKLQIKFAEKFGSEQFVELTDILFIIGIQECGVQKSFDKDDKLNLMHVAVCKILEPYGYYSFIGRDKQGWPHYKLIEKLPKLKSGEQKILLKQAILQYFEDIV